MSKKKKECKPSPVGRRFFLKRRKDASGVSGIGMVALGIQMPSRKVVIEWLTETPSEGIYDSLEECLSIHGHEGATQVEWIDNLELMFVIKD